ncbi:hypothetical protein K2X92_03080 [Candidatus Gracilibacteria bacterium]|nr:hypothetical protein [Candidatus Gracilibacteria bacterium]
MIELQPETLKLLSRAINGDVYNKNIGILSSTKYGKHLYKDLNYKNLNELLNSTENIPRVLENYLVVDFEKKRTLICDFLFSIHMEYPRIFTLEKYLNTTKRIFGLITQYKWSREDISFVLKTIIIYLDMYMKDLSKESIMIMLKRFGSYGPWKDSELKSFIYEQSCIKLLQKNIIQRVTKKIHIQKVVKFSRLKKILMKFGFMRKIMMQN